MVGWFTYALSLVAYMREHLNNTTYIFVNSMQLNFHTSRNKEGENPSKPKFQVFPVSWCIFETY